MAKITSLSLAQDFRYRCSRLVRNAFWDKLGCRWLTCFVLLMKLTGSYVSLPRRKEPSKWDSLRSGAALSRHYDTINLHMQPSKAAAPKLWHSYWQTVGINFFVMNTVGVLCLHVWLHVQERWFLGRLFSQSCCSHCGVTHYFSYSIVTWWVTFKSNVPPSDHEQAWMQGDNMTLCCELSVNYLLSANRIDTLSLWKASVFTSSGSTQGRTPTIMLQG